MKKREEGGKPGLHVLAKPIGPVCDIKCDYCFYLEKHALFDKGENYRMSDDVLKAYISDVNYPGSTYTLQYDPASDRLKGEYYQAVEKQPRLVSGQVDVGVYAGHVVLVGVVDNWQRVEDFREDVRSVPGVLSVWSYVQVGTP